MIEITRKLMPHDVLDDGLYLVLASYHKCNYLITWNCKHLTHPNKFKHICIENTSIGVYTPKITTQKL